MKRLLSLSIVFVLGLSFLGISPQLIKIISAAKVQQGWYCGLNLCNCESHQAASVKEPAHHDHHRHLEHQFNETFNFFEAASCGDHQRSLIPGSDTIKFQMSEESLVDLIHSKRYLTSSLILPNSHLFDHRLQKPPEQTRLIRF